MNNQDLSPKEKGERLQYLRNLVRLTQKELAEIIQVSLSGYKGWENGRHGGIPEKRAIFLIKFFEAEGIQCSLEWLMYGIGSQPEKQRDLHKNNIMEIVSRNAKNEKEIMQDELHYFRSNYLNSIDFVVPDNLMMPNFLMNDIVAGVKLSSHHFQEAIGLNCIVQLVTGEILLRQLQQGIKKDYYSLLCTTPTDNKEIIIHEVKLINVAPVLWHRREKLTF